mgnify:CR=1 FL=1
MQNVKSDTTGDTAAGSVRFHHMVKSVKEIAHVQRTTVILQKDATLASILLYSDAVSTDFKSPHRHEIDINQNQSESDRLRQHIFLTIECILPKCFGEGKKAHSVY